MENWSISDLVEEDWSISDIVEANEKRYVRERERLMKRKRPVANLSVTELEQMRQEALRIIAACGLCPEGEIESAQERQIGCKNILTDQRVTTEKSDVGQSSGEGSTEETHANPAPDE
ncbi:hypothetical protein BRARA_G03616 [Brassica rapa]|uniref:Uncharacterized protein n=1 Tax=Brassica campestris TaxID=3711 RepID=M4F1X2_BRACM|nr:uncharacterized protein LOC103832361 [Brassica rapa]RID56416.1 hypothetical protein BRARA_G03616 [Brassica rapa]